MYNASIRSSSNIYLYNCMTKMKLLNIFVTLPLRLRGFFDFKIEVSSGVLNSNSLSMDSLKNKGKILKNNNSITYNLVFYCQKYSTSATFPIFKKCQSGNSNYLQVIIKFYNKRRYLEWEWEKSSLVSSFWKKTPESLLFEELTVQRDDIFTVFLQDTKW